MEMFSKKTTVFATTMGWHRFSHVKRQGYVVAHELVLDLIIWMEDLPSDFYHVNMFDLITE